MTRIDSEFHFSDSYNSGQVCTECFDDCLISDRIQSYENSGYCKYCEEDREHVAPFEEVAQFIGDRMRTFFGHAVDQLPYISREGGYQGRTEDTHECLFGTIGLGIEAKKCDLLADDLITEIGDDLWCDFDWLSLEIDQSLRSSWDQFCSITRMQRRFFFHSLGGSEFSHPDERSVSQFLVELAALIEARDLIQTMPVGTVFYRARPNDNGSGWSSPNDLGPPPAAVCLQSNRMNPPGIAMFYGAGTRDLAIAETRQTSVTVGRFETTRPLRVVNLAELPPVPGFFSEATREELQTLAFLHDLSEIMARPVAQDNRVNVEYIPTQIVTEFLRDFPFSGGHIDGISYVTALGLPSFNTVLFATQEDVVDSAAEEHGSTGWLRLAETEVVRGP